MSLLYEGCASISPHQIVTYAVPVGGYNRRHKNINSLRNLQTNSTTAVVSHSSRSRIIKYINWIIAQAQTKKVWDRDNERFVNFKVNFITLTLPHQQVHSDEEIKAKCLNQWLIELRHKFVGVHYFWRAEKQGNGNIHFHIITDVYYHHVDLRNDWNRIINKLGYVDSYTHDYSGITLQSYMAKLSVYDKRTMEQKRKAWQRGVVEGWLRPNTTDVHATKNIANLAGYVAKYCAKDEKEKLVSGKRYGCDQVTVKHSKLRLMQNDSGFSSLESILQSRSVNILYRDFVTIYIAPWHKILSDSNEIYGHVYQSHINSLRNNSPPSKRE